MAAYEIGERIRKARENMHMTQEELAYGICATGTLSKIENGLQVPTRKNFEALMQRLGEPEYLYSIHLSREEMQCMKILRQIERYLQKGNLKKVEELLNLYQNFFEENKILDKQSYQMFLASWHAKQGMPPQLVIEELQSALQLTMKSYTGDLPNRKKCLTFEEIAILNNIAVQYSRMREREKPFSYLKWLKEYLEINPMDEEERAKVYAVILCNYADCLLVRGFLNEAQQAAEHGICVCREYTQILVLPYLMGTLAHSLVRQGRKCEAEEYFSQAECLLYAMECYESLEHLRENDREKLALLLYV